MNILLMVVLGKTMETKRSAEVTIHSVMMAVAKKAESGQKRKIVRIVATFETILMDTTINSY